MGTDRELSMKDIPSNILFGMRFNTIHLDMKESVCIYLKQLWRS